MPAFLITLPTEIINQILGSIGESSCLLNAALTCRFLYELTIPQLYFDVQLAHHGHFFPHLKPFSIRILKHPELASHVHSFTLGDKWETDGDIDDYDGDEVYDDAVQRTVHKFSHSEEEEEEWILDLYADGNEDAWLGLLFPSLPNIQRLDLLVPEMAKTDTKYFSKMIMERIPNREKPFDAHPAFSSLKVVITNCIADEYGEPLDLLSSFLKLPSLTDYYCQKVGSHDDDADAELAQLKTVNSALTHLELR